MDDVDTGQRLELFERTRPHGHGVRSATFDLEEDCGDEADDPTGPTNCSHCDPLFP
jgi:hypothetical protein